MHYSSAVLTIASALGLATAKPLAVRAPHPLFPAGVVWDIVLDSSKVTLNQLRNAPGKVLDIDLFVHTEDGKTDIRQLAQTKTVVCYFSAGSREDWRPDAGDFNPEDYGKNMTGWEGENWVDIKQPNVMRIMKKRIDLAAASGCHAVDPDNVDGYSSNHQDGYRYEPADYVTYIRELAKYAHGKNLAIGLKNSVEIIGDLVKDDVDFAVNEQCHEEKECDKYRPFTTEKKAVFVIEYNNRDCSQPSGVTLSQVNKPANQDLDTIGGQCSTK